MGGSGCLLTSAEFDHAKERRSLKHRYSEMEGPVKSTAEAAYHNERSTRERVQNLEGLMARPLIGRLKWLLLGE